MIGKTFGCYKVLDFADDKILSSGKKRKRILCKCIYCGSNNIKDPYKVAHNNYQYCDNCNPHQMEVKESLVGKRFGRLTVIKRVENHIQPNGSSKVMWLCLCDCGEYVTVQDYHLKSGHTKSCGCYAKDTLRQILVKDLTGQRFGKLTVIEKAYIKNGRQYWLCKCDCGRTCIVSSAYLTSNKKISCGCETSTAEYEMKIYFEENNILYNSQYTFEDCKYKRKLPFDFAVFHPKTKKLMFLIELNGGQHYYPFTFNGENEEKKIENFEHRKILDNIKVQYCEKNKIPLLIIKYTNFNLKEQIFEAFYKDSLNNPSKNNYIFKSQDIKNNKSIGLKRPLKRKVVQIDLKNKEIVRYFNSIAEACRAFNTKSGAIVDCCKMRMKTAYGYAWAYNDENFDLEKTIVFASSPDKTVALKILQKDMENNIVKEWDSITEACNYYNVSHQSIQSCCAGKQKTCKGFKWEYKDGNRKQKYGK